LWSVFVAWVFFVIILFLSYVWKNNGMEAYCQHGIRIALPMAKDDGGSESDRVAGSSTIKIYLWQQAI
jgi:hypothetical protein